MRKIFSLAFFIIFNLKFVSAQTMTSIQNSFYDRFITRANNLISYGSSFGDSLLDRGDDSSTRVNLTHSIYVYNRT